MRYKTAARSSLCALVILTPAPTLAAVAPAKGPVQASQAAVLKVLQFARDPAAITAARIQTDFPGTYVAIECASDAVLCDFVSEGDPPRPRLWHFSVASHRAFASSGGRLMLELPKTAPCLSTSQLDTLTGKKGETRRDPPAPMSFSDEPLPVFKMRDYRNLNEKSAKVHLTTMVTGDCVTAIMLDARIQP